jgi:hypothetical protein
MIRIQLDRIHLELLLLAGLFATFSGVVFPPIRQNGMNMTPLVAFCGVVIVGIGVLVHRRIFTDSTDTRSQRRATIWFAIIGAIVGAAVSSVVGTSRLLIAAIGGGLMFSAIGTQFNIVIKSRDEAARDAVETILDEQNVFVTPEHRRSDATNDGANEKARETDEQTETETSAGNGSAEDANDTTETETDNGSATEEQVDDAIEQIDVSASSDWKQSAPDDNIPIPVIRSIESSDYSDE